MKLALITTTLSPHQLPLAQRLAEGLGEENFRYIAVAPLVPGRLALGWSEEDSSSWLLQPARFEEDRGEAESWSREADVVLCGTRDVRLYQQRESQKKVSLYMSERWFKPPFGIARLLHPTYAKVSLNIVELMQSTRFFYFPMGMPAAADFWRMETVLRRFSATNRSSLCAKMRLWGYFVEPSKDVQLQAVKYADQEELGQNSGIETRVAGSLNTALRVLWCGRYLSWKRVDTLIRAVACVGWTGHALDVTLVGLGPNEQSLRRLAGKLGVQVAENAFKFDAVTLFFRPPVPVAEVRSIMRKSDIYVVTSNGYEGWGAVINEAMEEGCAVVVSRESGAASALVRDGENGLKFSAGDSEGLANALIACIDSPSLRAQFSLLGQRTMREQWSPTVGAERLLAFAESALGGKPLPDYREGPLRSLL